MAKSASAAKRSKARAAKSKAVRSKASARKPVKAHTAKRRPAPRAARPKPSRQKFVASHLGEGSFAEGLRAYAQYRELGIKDATGGLVQAHVIRFVPPCRPEEVSKLHYHDVEFQMIYVLKGWIKSEFAGEGTHTFHAGACWLQPPRIEHKVLDYSDDCEVLEVILPADFETVTLD
jgi:hypothetical protein